MVADAQSDGEGDTLKPDEALAPLLTDVVKDRAPVTELDCDDRNDGDGIREWDARPDAEIEFDGVAEAPAGL